MSSQEEQYDKAAKEILVEMVTALLVDKPKDPVPYMYSYFQDLASGKKPKPLTDNELNELRNLKKKVEYLKE